MEAKFGGPTTSANTCVVDVYLETDNQHCDCRVKSFYSCILIQISTERSMAELPTKVWVDGTLSPPKKKWNDAGLYCQTSCD